MSAHKERERVVYYGWMPQQHDHKEGRHQLLSESRIRALSKSWVIKTCLALGVAKCIMIAVVYFSIINLLVSDIHDLWMRLLLHYLGDILVVSRSHRINLILVPSPLRIAIFPPIAANHFLAAFIPSPIDCIEPLHIFALVWNIMWIIGFEVVLIVMIVLRIPIGYVSCCEGLLNDFIWRTVLFLLLIQLGRERTLVIFNYSTTHKFLGEKVDQDPERYR